MLAWLSRAHPVCLPVHSWSVKLLWDGGLAGALLGEQPVPTKPMGLVSLDAVTSALMHPLEQPVHLLRCCWVACFGHGARGTANLSPVLQDSLGLGAAYSLPDAAGLKLCWSTPTSWCTCPSPAKEHLPPLRTCQLRHIPGWKCRGPR